MTTANQTVTTNTATGAATEAAVAAVAAPKAPSKKSLALAIFQTKLVERAQGMYATNKDFRAAVLSTIEKDLGVSTASAATMYNAAKKDAEAADATVALGRDPKKVKVKVEGAKRGRPAGTGKKAKAETVVIPAAETAVSGEVAPAADVAVVGTAVPADASEAAA